VVIGGQLQAWYSDPTHNPLFCRGNLNFRQSAHTLANFYFYRYWVCFLVTNTYSLDVKQQSINQSISEMQCFFVTPIPYRQKYKSNTSTEINSVPTKKVKKIPFLQRIPIYNRKNYRNRVFFKLSLNILEHVTETFCIHLSILFLECSYQSSILPKQPSSVIHRHFVKAIFCNKSWQWSFWRRWVYSQFSIMMW
jgi:hypothetical protein